MSVYKPKCDRSADGRRIWRVVRYSKWAGGWCYVWWGISKESCRRALAEFRECEERMQPEWAGLVQSLLYSADNAKTDDMRSRCLRRAFRVAYAATAAKAVQS